MLALPVCISEGVLYQPLRPSAPPQSWNKFPMMLIRQYAISRTKIWLMSKSYVSHAHNGYVQDGRCTFCLWTHDGEANGQLLMESGHSRGCRSMQVRGSWNLQLVTLKIRFWFLMSNEWSLHEIQNLFVSVFCHKSICKSILLCAVYFSPGDLKSCLKRIGENQIPPQDPFLSEETSKAQSKHAGFFFPCLEDRRSSPLPNSMILKVAAEIHSFRLVRENSLAKGWGFWWRGTRCW